MAGAAGYFDKADVDGLLAAISARSSRSDGDTPAAGTDASDEPLTVYVRAWPELARVHIAAHGALRGAAAGRALAPVAKDVQPGCTVIVDLSDITAIDELGIAALAECHRLADARGAELELHDPSPVARRALRARPL
jgi:ABC-type transporter Mla MlaB component